MKLSSTSLELPLISTLFPPHLVGHYSLANTFREAAMMPQSLYSGILQNVLIDKNTGDTESARQVLLMALMFQGLLSIAIATTAALLLPYAIPLLYGSSFIGAEGISLMLIVSALFAGLSGLCWISFNAIGKPQYISLVLTVGGLLTPVLIYYMSEAYGLYGAGAASIAASFVTFMISFGLAIKLNDCRTKDFVAAWNEGKKIVVSTVFRGRGYRS